LGTFFTFVEVVGLKDYSLALVFGQEEETGYDVFVARHYHFWLCAFKVSKKDLLIVAACSEEVSYVVYLYISDPFFVTFISSFTKSRIRLS